MENNGVVWKDAWMSEVVCPHCNHIYDIGIEYQLLFNGKIVWCPNCENDYMVRTQVIFATEKSE